MARHAETPENVGKTRPLILAPARQDHPDIRTWIPRATAIITQQRRDLKAGLFEAASHLRDRQRSEGQRKVVRPSPPAAAFDELLVEDRQAPCAILPHGFDQRDVRTPAPASPSPQAHALPVLVP